MVEGSFDERLGSPAPETRLGLVDPVPADTSLERPDVLEALAAVRARGATCVRSRGVNLSPAAAACLPAASARDPEPWISLEGVHEALEELGRKRDVRVELDDDVDVWPQKGDTGLEAGDVSPVEATLLER
jgi:hypothetical protein